MSSKSQWTRKSDIPQTGWDKRLRLWKFPSGQVRHTTWYPTLVNISLSNTPTQAGYHSQLRDKVVMFHAAKVFCQNVSSHLVHQCVLNLDMFFFDM